MPQISKNHGWILTAVIAFAVGAGSFALVREALKLLQHEGFLSIKPRSYVDICKPDLNESMGFCVENFTVAV